MPRARCNGLKLKLLAPLRESAEYKQAQSPPQSARAESARAKAAVASDPTDAVVALANTVLAEEAVIQQLEQQALNASPDWKAADAQLQQATKSLSTLRNTLEEAQAKRARPLRIMQ